MSLPYIRVMIVLWSPVVPVEPGECGDAPIARFCFAATSGVARAIAANESQRYEQGVTSMKELTNVKSATDRAGITLFRRAVLLVLIASALFAIAGTSASAESASDPSMAEQCLVEVANGGSCTSAPWTSGGGGSGEGGSGGSGWCNTSCGWLKCEMVWEPYVSWARWLGGEWTVKCTPMEGFVT
jgi:hypothetical protein